MATQTTGGGSTTSFSNTPQAKDDIFTGAERDKGMNSLRRPPAIFQIASNPSNALS